MWNNGTEISQQHHSIQRSGKTQGRCDTYWQKGGNSIPKVMVLFRFELSGTLHTHKWVLKVWTRTTSCTSLINSLMLPETSQGAEGLQTHPSREEILTEMMTILTAFSLSLFFNFHKYLFTFILILSYGYQCFMCMFFMHHLYPQRPEEGSRQLWVEPCGYWKLNPGLL